MQGSLEGEKVPERQQDLCLSRNWRRRTGIIRVFYRTGGVTSRDAVSERETREPMEDRGMEGKVLLPNPFIPPTPISIPVNF